MCCDQRFPVILTLLLVRISHNFMYDADYWKPQNFTDHYVPGPPYDGKPLVCCVFRTMQKCTFWHMYSSGL